MLVKLYITIPLNILKMKVLYGNTMKMEKLFKLKLPMKQKSLNIFTKQSPTMLHTGTQKILKEKMVMNMPIHMEQSLKLHTNLNLF
jgi:hypothetical protein